jgi:hypothetical protein
VDTPHVATDATDAVRSERAVPILLLESVCWGAAPADCDEGNGIARAAPIIMLLLVALGLRLAKRELAATAWDLVLLAAPSMGDDTDIILRSGENVHEKERQVSICIVMKKLSKARSVAVVYPAEKSIK